MSTAPIRVPIVADDQYSAALSTAQARVREFGAASGLAGEAATRNFKEARGAAALLSDEIGVKLNKHLRSVLASSQLIGPALELAFPIAAAVGFGTVAVEAFDKIKAAVTDEAFTKAAEDIYEKIREKLARSVDEAKKLNRELQLAQAASAAARTSLEFKFKTEDATDANQSVRDVEAEIERFQALLARDENNPWYRSPREIDEIKANLKNLYGQLGVAVNEVQNREAAAGIAGVAAFKARTDEVKKFQEALDKAVARYGVFAPGEGTRLAAFKNQLIPLTDLVKNPGVPTEQTIDPAIADRYLRHFKDLQAVFEATRTPAELLAVSIENLNTLFRGDTSSEVYKRAVEQIKNKYDEARAAVQRFGEEAGDALKQGILMGRSWRDVLESLIVSISQLIVKMYVLKALQASSFGSSGFGSFLSSLLSGLTGRAGGGPVYAGTPYMVGESGPEIFMPNTSGSIVPNGRWGGGAQVIYQIDARGGTPGIERDILRALKQTENQAVARAVAITRENGLRGRS